MAIKFKVDEEQKKLDKKRIEAIKRGDKKVKKEKATFKHEVVESKTKLEKIRKIVFIISCIALLTTFNIVMAPIASTLLGLGIGVIWFFIAAVGTLGSLGLLWLTSGFKNLNSSLLNAINKCFDGTDKIAEITKKIIPVAFPICAVLIIASFVLCLICFIKKKKGNTALFVISSIIMALFLVFITISLIATYTK